MRSKGRMRSQPPRTCCRMYRVSYTGSSQRRKEQRMGRNDKKVGRRKTSLIRLHRALLKRLGEGGRRITMHIVRRAQHIARLPLIEPTRLTNGSGRLFTAYQTAFPDRTGPMHACPFIDPYSRERILLSHHGTCLFMWCNSIADVYHSRSSNLRGNLGQACKRSCFAFA